MGNANKKSSTEDLIVDEDGSVVELDYEFDDGSDNDTILIFRGREYRLSSFLVVPTQPGEVVGQMARNPARYQRWSSIAAVAEGRAKKAKENLEYIDAMLDRTIRTEFAARGERATDDKTKAAIATRDEHRDAFDAWVHACTLSDIVKAFVRALDHKHTLLLSINANNRTEAHHIESSAT